MTAGYPWFILFSITAAAEAFVNVHLPPATRRLSPGDSAAADRILLHNDNANTLQFRPALLMSKLASSFPADLPAGLRGEAVRSALRSPNGICVDYTSPSTKFNINVGVVKVQGKGARQFLEGKLSNSFGDALNSGNLSSNQGRVVDACLLTARGRTIDRITVPTFLPADTSSADGNDEMEAYMITSPGHAGSELFNRLDPFVFSMDEIKLIDMMDSTASLTTRVFAVGATKLKHVKDTVRKLILPNLQLAADIIDGFTFPMARRCSRIISSGSTGNGSLEIVVLPSTFLPECVCAGYTFIICEQRSSSSGDGAAAQTVWEALTAEHNDEAPVEIGPLEWDTLRIEGGWPAYGWEMTGDADPKNAEQDDRDYAGARPSVVEVGAKASPLELHLDSTVDESKGCYLGQEAVAALLKNKRGMPRTLHSVVFNDSDNDYENGDSEDVDDDIADLAALLGAAQDGSKPKSKDVQATATVARLPLPGDELYVLGSAGKIKAGIITSVAENGGTGDPTTVGLALIRRPDSILSKMESMGLELGGGIDPANDPLWQESDIPSSGSMSGQQGSGGDGISAIPPPVDPLDGLEVIIEGTNTFGTLQSLPWRRYKNGRNMFDAEVEAFQSAESDGGSVMGIIDSTPKGGEENKYEALDFVPAGWDASSTDVEESDEEDLRRAKEEAAAAAAEAEAAAAEAKRKAEKMEMLTKKAEAAMARRRKKKKKS